LVASRPRISPDARGGSSSAFTLAAAVPGFFVITLDAVAVNITLPAIRRDLGGGMTGPQWLVDGYTPDAALLLSAGRLSDRADAVALCLGAVVVVARFVQGAAAAVMMASSMARGSGVSGSGQAGSRGGGRQACWRRAAAPYWAGWRAWSPGG